jgi:hypothetical protein
MNNFKKTLFLLLLVLPALSAHAQANLNIDKIFNNYGKQDGAVLIELAKDVLGNYTAIHRYKSLIVPTDSAKLNATLEAIKKDLQKGHSGSGLVLMETQKNGKVESATYVLGREAHSPTYEYILFKHKAQKLTLIYIRGNFPPEQLQDELDKLKDLFIKVNNKRIKL